MFFCPQKIRLLKLSVLFLLPSSFGIWFFIWLSLIVVFPFLLGFLCNLHYIFVDLARIMTGSSICQQMSDIGWHPLPGATKIYPRVSGDVLTLASTHFWEWKSVSVMVVGHKSLLYMLPLKVQGTWSPWFLLCGIFFLSLFASVSLDLKFSDVIIMLSLNSLQADLHCKYGWFSIQMAS
jgi:hypothetical protein